MSLEKPQVVDDIGTEFNDKTVVLSIIDHWDWADEHEHLLALQTKLNTYFAFVETRQIYEDYPAALGKAIRIDVIGKFPMPEKGAALIEAARAISSELIAGIEIVFAPLREES